MQDSEQHFLQLEENRKQHNFRENGIRIRNQKRQLPHRISNFWKKPKQKAKSIMNSEVSRFTQEPKIGYEEDKINAGPLGRVRIAEEKQQEAEEKNLTQQRK